MSHTFQLILLFVAGIAFNVNGMEYHVYVGDDCINYNLNSNDTCIIHCNKQRQKNLVFNCGNTGQCVFNCEQQKCFERGTLNAQDSFDLNTLSTGSECLKRSTINLPNYGNALFSMKAAKSFKEMTINSGTNTNNVIIDCTFGTGDECKHITINAQTAQFLQVIIGTDSQLKGTTKTNAIINCPENSLYSKGSSCIIDISNGGTLSLVTINTLYGIPNDLWLNTQTNVLLYNIKITCRNGTSDIFGYDSFNQGDCWIMDTTTISPTYYPTVMPTFSPTLFATNSPTDNPSKIPTNYPTLIPTRTPTRTPTHFPTTSIPTVIPTVQITNEPTNGPLIVLTTRDSVIVESALLTMDESNDMLESTELMIEMLKNDADEGISNIGLLMLIMGSGLTIFCCIGLYCMRTRYKKGDNINKNEHIIHYKLKSNSSNHVVKITMSPKSNSNTHVRVQSNCSDNVVQTLDVDMNACISIEDDVLQEPLDGDRNETNDTDTYYSSSEGEIDEI